jgi:competence protein ComEC
VNTPWARLLALVTALLAGLWVGATFRVGWWPWLPVVALGAAAAVALPGSVRWVGLVMLAGVLGLVRAELASHTPSPDTLDFYQGRVAVVRGWVDEAPEAHRGAMRVTVRVQELTADDAPARPVRGRLLAVVHGSTRLAYGDRVEAQGVLLAPRASERFDYADFLSRSDVWALLGNASLRRLGTGAGHPLYARLVAVKRGFIGAVRRDLPEPQAALLLGIVLGYRSALAPDLEVRMIDTGLIHIVVISGLKVAIFAGIVQRLCFRAVPRVALPLAVAGVGAYVVIAGASAAAVRAGVMGSAALVAHALHRQTEAFVSLACTAAAMLLVQPSLWRDVSFQLSFLGTAGIVLFTDPIRARFPWMPGLLAEPFAVTIAAQLATLPVMAQNFGVISLVGPVANALVLPVLPAVMTLGGAGGLVGAGAAWAGYLPLQAGGWVCAYIALVINLLGALPVAAAPAASFPPPLVAGYYVALGGGLVGFRLRTWFSRPLVWVALLTLAAVVSVLALARPDGRLQVVALDVGTGSAVLVQGPHGERVLIDGGPDADRLYQSLGRALPPGARHLQAVVLTGGGRPEIGGLNDLFARYRVDRLYLAPGANSFTARQLASNAAKRGIVVETLPLGGSLALGGVTLAPLGAGESWSVRYGARTVLVLPPAATEVVTALPPVDAVILTNGGPERLPPALLERSLTVVIEVNRMSREGLPARALQQQLAAAPQARVLRTDQAGNVTFTTDGRDFRTKP